MYSSGWATGQHQFGLSNNPPATHGAVPGSCLSLGQGSEPNLTPAQRSTRDGVVRAAFLLHLSWQELNTSSSRRGCVVCDYPGSNEECPIFLTLYLQEQLRSQSSCNQMSMSSPMAGCFCLPLAISWRCGGGGRRGREHCRYPLQMKQEWHAGMASQEVAGSSSGWDEEGVGKGTGRDWATPTRKVKKQ